MLGQGSRHRAPATVLPDRNGSCWLGVFEKVESVFGEGGCHDWESREQEGERKER